MSRVLALLLSLTLLAQAGAEAEARGRRVKKRLVPPGCWPSQGGSPMRSGVSNAAPLTGALEVAWECKLEGDIEGEPVVWDDTVAFSVRRSEEERELHVLRLADGKPIRSPMKFKSMVSLAPAIWGRRLAVRLGLNRLAVYHIGRNSLQLVWNARGHFEEPLLIGKNVYYNSHSEIEMRSGRSKAADWTSSTQPYSNLILVDDQLMVLTYDAKKTAVLRIIDPKTGYGTTDIEVGHHRNRKPHDGSRARLTCTGDNVFITFELEVPLQSGEFANSVWLQRAPTREGWRVRTYFQTDRAVSGTDPYWSTMLFEPGKRPMLVLREISREGKYLTRVLGKLDTRPDLVDVPGPTTHIGKTLWVGRHRCALDTLRLLEPLPFEPVDRVVPARDMVLAKRRDNVLVGLRETIPERNEHIHVPAIEGADSGHLVLADGAVRKTAFCLDPSGKVLRLGKKGRKQVDLDNVLLARAANGAITYAASAAGALRGFEVIAQRDEGKAYADLAKDAVKALSLRHAEGYVQDAEERGQGAAVAKWTISRIEELRKTPKAPKAAKLTELSEKEQKLLSRSTDFLWDSVAKLPADAPWHVRAEMLRAVLTRNPAHPGAAKAVRDAIPSGVPLPAGFDPTDWMTLADAAQRSPIAVVKDDPLDVLLVRKAKQGWRSDVLGLRSNRLLIVTPVENPARIAACLALGEMVCARLESMFGASPETQKNLPPLVLQLFESRDSYLKHMGGGGHGARHLVNTAGHYSPSANMSRIFIPEGEDPFGSVMETYAHELVHHWIQVRCPLPSTKGRRGHGARTPCFWLVEGIAELVSEFQFDVRRNEVRTFSRRAASLDAVAVVHPNQMIQAGSFYELPQAVFARLDSKKSFPIPMRWRLAWLRGGNQVTMFYMQGAATCQYLWHGGSKLRAGLIELVRRYYTGAVKPGDVQAVLGMTPDQLAKRVRQYALDVQSGRITRDE